MSKSPVGGLQGVLLSGMIYFSFCSSALEMAAIPSSYPEVFVSETKSSS